jgi:hypothetical protein
MIKLRTATSLGLVLLACGDSVGPPGGNYPFPPGKVFFSHPPIDLGGVASFVAMGEPNVFPRDHGGFPLLVPHTLPANIPVFAVADGVVVLTSNGVRAIPDVEWVPESLRGQEYDDHLIQLKVSETIIVNYAHVTDFHPSFAEKVGDLPRTESGIEVFVPVEAGDTLAFVGPHPAMDFSVTDFSLELGLLNTTFYPERHYFSADVYDYFQGALLDEMIAIAARDRAPWGGKIDYDIPGRIVGNWFQEGTTSFVQNSRQLAIVYDHIWSDRITISDGSPMRDVPGLEGPGAPDVWWVKGNEPRPDDLGVGDGVIHFGLIHRRSIDHSGPDDGPYPVQAVMLVEMIDAGRIRVEVFKGVTEAQGFTAAAKIYER